MAPTFPSITELLTNNTEVFQDAVNVLLRVSKNIINDPKNPKFRTLSLGSRIVQDKLLAASGAIECLFEMGFEENVNSLVLPSNKSIDNLRIIHNILQKKINEKPQPSTSKISKPLETLIPVTPIINLNDIHNSLTNQFLKNVIKRWEKVQHYEKKDVQLRALQSIPLEQLKNKVELIIRSKQADYKSKKNVDGDSNIDYQELMLSCLIDWFKNEYFTWINVPECSACKAEGILVSRRGSDNPSIDTIEVYKCKVCNKELLFPRYNDGNELLKTKSGRCGEWAICFTLMCRSMGWDARLVHDETDHAWTEVFLNIPQIWIHCDPCEGILDAPLLYEAGWKKQLTYIIAYSCEEVQDVTWRYSCQHKQVLKRRQLCQEIDLANLIVQIRERCCETFSPARRDFVIHRCLKELVSFSVQKQPSEKDLQGRISGSENWKRARLEIGDECNHVWKLKSTDIVDKKIAFEYSVVKDEYLKNGQTVKSGFQSGLAKADNVLRKIEKDWRMVYLARAENDNKGELTWEFELDEDICLESVEIKFHATCFKTGIVSLELRSDNIIIEVITDGSSSSYKEFSGCKNLSMCATLNGGEGSVAWQHAQLFRTNLNDLTTQMQIVFNIQKQ